MGQVWGQGGDFGARLQYGVMDLCLGRDYFLETPTTPGSVGNEFQCHLVSHISCKQLPSRSVISKGEVELQCTSSPVELTMDEQQGRFWHQSYYPHLRLNIFLSIHFENHDGYNTLAISLTSKCVYFYIFGALFQRKKEKNQEPFEESN